MFTSTLFITALAGAALANPVKLTGCSLKAAVPDIPAGQTTLSVPSGLSVEYVALGLGVQNYTCGSTGTYTSVPRVLFFDSLLLSDCAIS